MHTPSLDAIDPGIRSGAGLRIPEFRTPPPGIE